MLHYKVYSPCSCQNLTELEGVVKALKDIDEAHTKELNWYREYCAKLEQRIIDLHEVLEVAMR